MSPTTETETPEIPETVTETESTAVPVDPPKKPKRPKRRSSKKDHVDGAVRFSVDPTIASSKALEVVEYWIGVLPSATHQYVTVAGHTFPRFTGQLAVEDGEIIGKKGAIAHLTAEVVEKIVKSVKGLVLRRIGTGGWGQIHRIDESHFRPDPDNDSPLAQHLFMVRTDSIGMSGRDTFPEPMLIAEE